MIKLYGIKNCDTCRRARKWMDAEDIEYQFCDFRVIGLKKDKLKLWSDQLGWEALLNRRGMTWRQLPESTRKAINQRSAETLMFKNSTLIKRPVIEAGHQVFVGFTVSEQEKLQNLK